MPVIAKEGDDIRLGASSRVYKVQWQLPNERMSQISLLVGLGAMSHIMLNGGVTNTISLTISLRHGYPLSPLLFVFATHRILVKMHALTTCGEIVELALPIHGNN